MSKKPRANQRVQVGALGLDRDSSFDDDEYDDDDILDDDDGNITLTRDELQRIVAMAGKGQLHLAEEDDGDEDDGDEIGGSGIDRLIATINRGFTKMSESIDGLYDMLDGDEDDEDEGFDIPADPRNARTIEQMQRISESARPVPGPVIEETEPEVPATQNVTEGN